MSTFGNAVGEICCGGVIIKGSGRGVSLVVARRRGVLARPVGKEHGETGVVPGFDIGDDGERLEKYVCL